MNLHLKVLVECLDFAELRGFEIVELVIDYPDVFDHENKKEFIELINSYYLKKQILYLE